MPYKDPEKQKKYLHEHYLKNHDLYKQRRTNRKHKLRQYVIELKNSTPCTDCLIQYPYYVMEFDHLRDKTMNINKFVKDGTTLDKLKKEIEKCEIVCANCHKERTFKRLASLVKLVDTPDSKFGA